ncbi:unnamed protein product [Mycena citricolor]|uniref:NAD(P)-binding domain-containing protein n=1 Tax=Mycena citricolor TaxID=2018698 RepID=A0AAD2HBC6_9AGAR|nr:unnamed protein product [Mycena citricolor]
MSTVSKKVIIIGGHGNTGLRLARILSSAAHSVTSLIRNPAHAEDVRAAQATPLLLSLEDAPVSELSMAFAGTDVVYFTAGAGGKGGPLRTRAVDCDGAIKVFDAIEGVEAPRRPRLVLLSAIDVRNPAVVPAHYNEDDIAISTRTRAAIGTYMQCKYDADKNLAQRTAFKWTILRPTGLTNEPGTGKATIGRTHMMPMISREDVALALASLVDREGAAGLGIDIVGGETPIAEGLDAFIKKGESDFLG